MLTNVAPRVEVQDWRTQFEAWDRKRSRSTHTADAHASDLNVWCRWFREATGFEFTPDGMNSFDLARFRAWSLDTEQVSPATWNRRLATLRVLADWISNKAGIRLPEDLFEGVHAKEQVAQAPEWLTDSDFAKLGRYIESTNYEGNTDLRRLRSQRGRAIAAVMVYAGLREKEVADLLVADVTFGERKVWVTVRSGKGDKAREVPVGAVLLKILKRWVETARPCGYLFANETGGRLSERAIQEQMGEMGRLSGIDDLRAHRLRHTFCKRLADAGVGLEKVAQLAGHSSLEVTRRYVQPGREDLEAVIDLVSQGKLAKRRRE